MDPFLSHENLEHMSRVVLPNISKKQVFQMADRLSITTPMQSNVSSQVRVETLNRRLVQSLSTVQLPTALPIQVREQSSMDSTTLIAPPTETSASFRIDERIVVINAFDAKNRNNNVPTYNFRINLGYPFSNSGPTGPVDPPPGENTTNDLPSVTTKTVDFSLQEIIRDCVDITPVALFVPKRDVQSGNAFLVLDTDVASSNRMMSSSSALDGANVLMAPVASPADQGTDYLRFTNITGTVLRSRDPKRRITSLRIKVRNPFGQAFTATPLGDAVEFGAPSAFPHLVLKLRSRVPN